MTEALGRRAGGGLTHHAICAAIDNGKTTLRQLQDSVGGQRISVGMLPQVLLNMSQAGLLQRLHGHYRLTPKGREILGARGYVGSVQAYVPPQKAYRRPGSEVASSLPSLYAGVPR